MRMRKTVKVAGLTLAGLGIFQAAAPGAGATETAPAPAPAPTAPSDAVASYEVVPLRGAIPTPGEKHPATTQTLQAMGQCSTLHHTFDWLVHAKNALGLTMFTTYYHIEWDTNCNQIVNGFPSTRITHDTTSAGIGWNWAGIAWRENKFVKWGGSDFGSFHDQFQADWDNVNPLVGDEHYNFHADVYGDGFACIESTGLSGRNCYQR